MNGKCGSKIDVDGVVDLYESYIIPLTKEVEVCTLLLFFFAINTHVPYQVDYLLYRLDGLSEAEVEKLCASKSS